MLGDGDIKDILRRLDRLTQEEAQVAVTQTLEVVQGLVSNMKVVMDGASEHNYPVAFLIFFSEQTEGSQRKVFVNLSVSSGCGCRIPYSG